MGDFEIVSVPETFKQPISLARQAFDAAVKVSAEGRGVRVRCASDDEALRFNRKFCGMARLKGYKGHTQRQTNNAFICWVDAR